MLSQITTYHIFNFLVPGAIFAYIGQYISQYSIIQDSIIIGLILYYFIGVVISRVGSLIIESLLKKMIDHAPYPLYIKASELDPKINDLTEVNNTYRTYCSLFVSLGLLKIYEYVKHEYIESVLKNYGNYEVFILVIALLILFYFSYEKQTKYIVKRVNIVLNEEGE